VVKKNGRGEGGKLWHPGPSRPERALPLPTKGGPSAWEKKKKKKKDRRERPSPRKGKKKPYLIHQEGYEGGKGRLKKETAREGKLLCVERTMLGAS